MADIITKTQKLIKVGNSYAVTIDKQFVQQHFSSQPQAEIKIDMDRGEFSVRPAIASGSRNVKHALSEKITPELQQWTQKFLRDNKEALEKLANL